MVGSLTGTELQSLRSNWMQRIEARSDAVDNEIRAHYWALEEALRAKDLQLAEEPAQS
jgi:hypothetical protein